MEIDMNDIEEEEEEEEDHYLMERNVLLRNYQIHLVELAKNKNTVIFLPTGSGKTLIAVHVLYEKSQEIKKPYSEGGKRAFFITNTKVLVYQIGTTLRTHTKFKVGCYTGDMNVDSWGRQKWLSQFHKYHILVLTAEILRQILFLGFIRPENISIVVFDECHNAVADHPFRAIMGYIRKTDVTNQPLILGLSAVLLKSNPKKGQVLGNIRELENTFMGKVITSSDMETILRFSATPRESQIIYKINKFPSYYYDVFYVYEEALNTLDNIVVSESDLSHVIPIDGKEFKTIDSLKKIKRLFSTSRQILEELGAYCGFVCTLYSIIIVEKCRLFSDDPDEIQVLIYVRTELMKARRILFKVMGEESPASIYNHSTNKVQQLIDTILKAHKECRRNATLVFVEQKCNAIILAFMLKKLAALGTDYDFIKAEFVIGSSIISNNNIFLETAHRKILKQFSSGDLNVIVATNVLQEGIDISSCNTVISFDFPTSYSSYFQSRGRARDANSTHYLFVNEDEVTKQSDNLEYYKYLENEVNKIVTEKMDEEVQVDNRNECPEEISIRTRSGEVIVVDCVTAIKCVYRYCFKLPQDKYSHLSPMSWYRNEKYGKQGFLLLPSVSPLRETVEGDIKTSSKRAKKSVFLKTVKLLYDLGELDEFLNPSATTTKEHTFIKLFPHYEVEKVDKSLPQPGTKSRKQIYPIKFAECLSGCLPQPGAKSYLHVICLTAAFEAPEEDSKKAIYDVLCSPNTYAIVSSKKLHKICQFPIFINPGQVNVDILVNNCEINLTESELREIKLFHFSLLKKIWRISIDAQVFDNSNKEQAFFIAPVEKTADNLFVLDWSIIRNDFLKGCNSAVVRFNPSLFQREKLQEELNWKRVKLFSFDSIQGTSTCLIPDRYSDGLRLSEDDSKPNFVMTEAEYEYFVISPNYRREDPPHFYIVAKICHNMTPFSPFPKEVYENYLTYYRDKYGVEITNPSQPLLKVCSISHCSNFNRPKQQNRSRKSREKYKEYEEHLVPELCDVFRLNRNFWIKATFLPTILNRIAHVYLVEEFRRQIVEEMGLGTLELPPNTSWRRLEVRNNLYAKEIEKADPEAVHLSLQSCLPLSHLKDKTDTKKSKIILDPERYMDEIGLCDLEYYVNALKNMDVEEELTFFNLLEKDDAIVQLNNLSSLGATKLNFFNSGKSELGLELVDLVEAFTSKSANDVFNYERFEILGDSFLKFATTLFLFKNYQDNEGILTDIKGKLVGNRNLLYCGLAKNLQYLINVTDFVPLSDWNPPLLSVPRRLVDCILSNGTEPAVIYRLDIPHEERFSGTLSDETYQKNEKIIMEYEKSSQIPTSSLLSHKVLSDKTIADCVEALIGVFLQAFGLSGAFEFLMWVDILPKTEGSFAELIEKPFQVSLFEHGTDESVMAMLKDVFYSELEDVLGYRFKNKALLLEALTHPSYNRNRSTNCYQRLEFLGDAVLDFLITVYIYETCDTLSPGQITDIRSSLVNNITFSCLTVRYEIHKYLLSFSSTLSTAIINFVSHQVSRNHKVDENVLILLEEKDCLMAKSVQVPKALGDVFESIAGAIFLDSGNSLEVVWNVFYKLMKQELDEFTKTVPKTCTRLLNEICGNKPNYDCTVVDNVVRVTCTVYYNGHEIKTFGFGANQREGKRSAAKIALKKILEFKS